MKEHLHKFFNQHKGARRLGLVTSFGLVGFSTWFIMLNVVEITTKATGPGAAIIATVFGAIAAPIMYYFHGRGKEDVEDSDEQP